jgi:hypothetical protein
MESKKLIHVRIDADTKISLNKEAVSQNRKLSNHVETVLKKHVEKLETSKHQPKKEI